MTGTQWKGSERMFAKVLQGILGVAKEFKHVLTATGRFGPQTHLQMDFAVGNGKLGFVGEVKRRVLPKWFTTAIIQIYRKGIEHERRAMFCFELTEVEAFVEVDGKKHRLERHWVAVPLSVMTELLEGAQDAAQTKSRI
jgi:hypothetical protein